MQQQHTSTVNIVTISSQYGSEGKKIAMKLAFRLRWRLADQEISSQIARQLELEEEEAVMYQEQTFGLVDRLLFSMRFSAPQATEAWASESSVPVSYDNQERNYRTAQRRVVKKIAETGNCVIIGHASQVLLADRPDALHVRIVAPLAQRVNATTQREQIDERRAFANIKSKDRKLAYYLQSQYGRNIDDPFLYDLIINSHALDAEGQVDLICRALVSKAQRLAHLTPEYHYGLRSL